MANVTVLFRVLDDTSPVPVPVDGATIRVFDGSGLFVTEGETGVTTPGSGELELTLLGDVAGVPYKVMLSKDGVVFTPTPTVNILVLDPPVTPNEFTFSAHLGMLGQMVKLIAASDDTVPVPLENTKIRVFDSVDSFITELMTNANGEAELVLTGAPDPGQTYILRFVKEGWTFVNGPTQQIAVLDPLPVGATNEFDFPAHRPVIPESQDADLCLMSGYFINTAKQPLRRLKIRCMPVDHGPKTPFDGFPGFGSPAVVSGKQIISEAVFETDETGYVEILLPRNGEFDVHIHGGEIASVPHYARIQVPDVAGIRLEDVFFPYITEVTYDPAVATLHVGESVSLSPTAMGSNLVEVPALELADFLTFLPADPTIISVVFQLDKVVITAAAVGSTVVQTTRKDNSYAVRRPEVPEIIVTPPAITVEA